MTEQFKPYQQRDDDCVFLSLARRMLRTDTERREYGNRISAISSLLFLAVLTQRAFLIDWKYSISLETYLQPKRIRWNYSMANLEGLAMRRHYWGNGALTNADATIATSIKRTPSVFGAWLRKTDFPEYFNYTAEVVTSMWYGGEHVSNNPYLAGHMKRLGTLHDDSAKLSPYRTRSLGTPSIIQRKERDCFAV